MYTSELSHDERMRAAAEALETQSARIAFMRTDDTDPRPHTVLFIRALNVSAAEQVAYMMSKKAANCDIEGHVRLKEEALPLQQPDPQKRFMFQMKMVFSSPQDYEVGIAALTKAMNTTRPEKPKLRVLEGGAQPASDPTPVRTAEVIDLAARRRPKQEL